MNDTFLKACRHEEVEKIPVWFMRQAGRSLPGYRELRKKYDVLTVTQTPELAAKVSLEPIDLLGVDAAILFADIMILPIAMGIDVKIVDAVGPVIGDPLDTPESISRLQSFSANNIEFIKETIRILRKELNVPLIGFSGAPFTLASYLIEGKPTRTWQKTKQFMLTHPEDWHRLMSVLAEGNIGYLKAQVDAGAQALQLFDSWVGCLSPIQYQQYVQPHVQHIFDSLKDVDVPKIYFGTNTAGILDQFGNLNCEVIGVDWRVTLTYAEKCLNGKVLQGNLDPALLLCDWDTVKREVDRMLEEINPKKGYIFNLGHGVIPETDDKLLRKLVEYIHEK